MIKRFGGVGKKRPPPPLPNAWRDRELVNPPNPKILGFFLLGFLNFRHFFDIVLKLKVSEKIFSGVLKR